MKLFTKKTRNLLFIACICGITIGFVGLMYFQLILPNSYHYNAQFKASFDINGDPKEITVDSMIYEPKHGTLENPSSDERPLVVLVHGFAMSKEFMRSIAIELALRGVTTISISMPGHGLTDPPFYYTNASPYCVIKAIDFMISENPNLHYAINQSRIGLIGHSMGAMTVIKAGYLDQRVNTTIAVAAPSGTSSLILSGNSYGLSLGGDLRDWVDLSSPRNLFFVLGEIDEAVKDEDAQAVMTNATGLTSVTSGVLYGDFQSGTARQYNLYPLMDHATEMFDPRSVTDMLKWIAKSFEIDESEFLGEIGVTQAYLRPLFAIVAILCSFLLILPLSSIILNKLFPNRQNIVETQIKEDLQTNDKRKIDWKQIIKHYCYFIAFVGLIPTLIGLLIPLNWSYGGTVIAEGSVPTIFICGICGILLIIINSKIKIINIDLKFGWSAPQTQQPIAHKSLKYLIYFAISYLMPLGLVVYFWSTALFFIGIAPYRLVPFTLTMLMLIPLNISNALILRRKIYPLLRAKWNVWTTRIFMPILNNLVVGISIAIPLSILIGTPIYGGFLFSFIFWTLLIFIIMILTDFPIAGWSYYMENSVFVQFIVPAILFAIILNVFPIGA